MADLVELLIGTGMRKGEALALHWNDVHLPEQALYVRYTLSAINNTHLVITTPKTRSSKNWIALSPRVTAALQHRAQADHPEPSMSEEPSDPFTGLVFHRPNGSPLRPQWVLNRFRRLASEADVPRITVHDLRHLAATLTITAGVPLTVVSKTLRHSTLSTTANLYAHLTQQAAHDAVDAVQTVLTQAEHTTPHNGIHWPLPRWLRPHRDHTHKPHNGVGHPYSPTPAPSSPHSVLQLGTVATTLRPPPPHNAERPSPHHCRNGL